ncbi:MAG TPA: hypothetical protein GXZ58_10795 [Bacilli bacterium]|nr:hypothetical protein [Bacilli bacterium]
MDNELKALIGEWEQALGTLASAIGNTPSFQFNQIMQNNLALIGNTMQATGNALIADSEPIITLTKIGNQIQAIGNTTVITSLFTKNHALQPELQIKGDLLQSFGSAISLPDLFMIENKSSTDLLNICVSILQSIGNYLQALATKIGANEKGTMINLAGSWIQTIGAFIQAFTQSIA